MNDFRRQQILDRKDLTIQEKRLYLAGIGFRYHGLSVGDLQYSPINVRCGNTKVMVPVNEQRDWMNAALSDIRKTLRNDWIIGIGSNPTGDMGMACASILLNEAFKHIGFTVKVLDLQDPSHTTKQRDSEGRTKTPIMDLDALVVHNLTTESTPDRIQAARDLAFRYEGCSRVFVVAGTNPVSFFRERMRLELDVALFFDGRFIKRRSV